MDRVQKIQHKGKEILYANYEGIVGDDKMLEVLNEAERIILEDNTPHLQLVNFKDTFATTGYMAAAKKFGKKTKHLTSKSAILGITGVKVLLLRSYNFVSGDKLKDFKSEEEAKDYLVE
ncbi:MAG: Unknown protein [uncultured Aureispira sp.]|uniref:STAS/SEC14 domain-containing protein n=1 Tax=uncultured Aureispira sp. TaxID=1331704 RepID=A0A6S6SKI6_9BACT|nr:MAG: Unknown protein [uncultured Aureispira sp.]